MAIHTIGDSHSFHGWNGVIPHYLGAILCHSFGTQKLKRCDIRNFGIRDGDTIIFCFGEIDCRCHVHNFILEGVTTYQDIIDFLIVNYLEAIELNIATAQIRLKNVCVYNIIPPICTQDIDSNVILPPFVGTDEERKRYTLYFNEKLKEKCIEKNYIFFDIYNDYADENGFLKKDVTLDNNHIYNGIHISKFMIESKILN